MEFFGFAYSGKNVRAGPDYFFSSQQSFSIQSLIKIHFGFILQVFSYYSICYFYLSCNLLFSTSYNLSFNHYFFAHCILSFICPCNFQSLKFLTFFITLNIHQFQISHYPKFSTKYYSYYG